jgi:hypothetical protein
VWRAGALLHGGTGGLGRNGLRTLRKDEHDGERESERERLRKADQHEEREKEENGEETPESSKEEVPHNSSLSDSHKADEKKDAVASPRQFYDPATSSIAFLIHVRFLQWARSKITNNPLLLSE